MRGRKPTPSALRLLRGNPGKRPISQAEPKPEALSPEVPPELVDVNARAEWLSTIVPALLSGQVTSADRVLALAHCELWGTWRTQLALAALHPEVVSSGRNRYPLPNPARIMANKTLALLVKIDAELGLTPSSRSRLSVTPLRPPASKLQAFLGGKHGA